MLEAIGEVKLVITDTKTGKQEEIIKNNTFTQRGYQATLNLNGSVLGLQLSPFSRPTNIVISTSTATPNRNTIPVPGIIDECLTPTGATERTWVEAMGATPMYGELRGRLPFTGSSRTFQTVAIVDKGSGAAGVGFTTANAYAYVRLDSPVTQAPFETIDIFYRVYFINTPGFGLPLGGDLVRHLGRRLFGFETSESLIGGSSNKSPQQTPSFTSVPNPDKYNFFAVVNNNNNITAQSAQNGNSGLASWRINNSTSPNPSFSFGGTSVGLDGFTGRVINSLAFGVIPSKTNRCVSAFKFADPNRTPIQTSWGKRNGAPSAFYDAAWSANGTGKIIPSGSWTGIYPDMYLVRIVDSGNVGSATYKLERQRFTHYNGNSWGQIIDTPPHLSSGDTSIPFPDSHGHQDFLNYKAFSERKLIRWDATGLVLIDIFNGEYKVFDANNDIAVSNANLPVTNIKQVEVANGFIYVACSDTGLWRINPAGGNNSVVLILNEPTHGVTSIYHQTGLILVAVVSNGFRCSDNWGTLFTPSSTWITDLGFFRAKSIVGCKSANRPNGELALYLTNGSDRRIIWWSRAIANGNAIDAFSSSGLYNLENTIQCSTFGDFWIVTSSSPSLRTFTFGSTNITVLSSGGIFTVSDIPVFGFFDENNTYYLSAFHNGGYSTLRNGSIVKVGAGDPGYPPAQSLTPGSIVYLGRNLVFSFGSVYTCSYEWENWGWDGSAWVKGYNGSKTTHSGSQAILDGLSVRFENGVTGTAFTTTDFYTIPVCYGVLGDNARYVDSSVTLTTSSGTSQASVANLTVPSSPPYSLALPASSNSNFAGLVGTTSVFLGGVFVPNSNLLFNGATPPSGGLVSFNITTGIALFHPSDSGKTFNCNYSYLTAN
jgi:hypothetical protein